MTRSEFEIHGEDGSMQAGTNERIELVVIPNETSRMRKRNAIKNALSPEAHKIQWLYGELDGVRCYVNDEGGKVSIVLTTQDLYP